MQVELEDSHPQKLPQTFATTCICFAKLHYSFTTNLKRGLKKREKPRWNDREIRKELEESDGCAYLLSKLRRKHMTAGHSSRSTPLELCQPFPRHCIWTCPSGSRHSGVTHIKNEFWVNWEKPNSLFLISSHLPFLLFPSPVPDFSLILLGCD